MADGEVKLHYCRFQKEDENSYIGICSIYGRLLVFPVRVSKDVAERGLENKAFGKVENLVQEVTYAGAEIVSVNVYARDGKVVLDVEFRNLDRLTASLITGELRIVRAEIEDP